ncbi:MAG: glycosyltransferase [Armatimonadota bacterium]
MPNELHRLNKIIELHQDKPIIVFLPGVDWNIPLFQRPHQLARAFARLGYLVFYCTPNNQDKVDSVQQLEDNLYLTANLYAVSKLSNIILLAYWATMRDLVTLFLPDTPLVYDYVDELGVFYLPKRKLVRDHNWMLSNASLVCATADRLYQQASTISSMTILCPNAVDYSFFHPNSAINFPTDIKTIAPSDVIGYYGALAEWFDYDLIKYLAQQLPEKHIVLIGVDYDKSLQKHNLPSYPNIHFLGPRPYSELPAYAAYFDVAIIPFKINDITRSTSPVKLFEYLAAGCPVVTTAMPECRKYKSVYVAETYDDFVQGIHEALAGEFDIAQIDSDAQANDWQQRAQMIIDALNRRLPVKNADRLTIISQ